MASAYLNTATDGSDPGLNWSVFNATRAVTLSGDRRTATPYRPTGTFEGASLPTAYNNLTFPTVTGTTRNVTGRLGRLQSASRDQRRGAWGRDRDPGGDGEPDHRQLHAAREESVLTRRRAGTTSSRSASRARPRACPTASRW
jgi:hypothetical protein